MKTLRIRQNQTTSNGGGSFAVTRGKFLQVGGAIKKAAPPSAPTPPAPGHRFVMLDYTGGRIYGRVTEEQIARKGVLPVTVQLAIPNADGVLMVTDCSISAHPDELKELSHVPVSKAVTMKHATMLAPFEAQDFKASAVEDDNKHVIDYKNIAVEGFASTFASMTPADRDGDVVASTAFNDTIAEFMKNPVLLIDHRNSVANIAGSFSKIGVNDKGLAVRAVISNSPDLRNVRFLIAEGHLKAFSIGGFFSFGADGRTIEKVNLYEISLVAVPANPDALFQMRALDEQDVKRATELVCRRNPSLLGSVLV